MLSTSIDPWISAYRDQSRTRRHGEVGISMISSTLDSWLQNQIDCFLANKISCFNKKQDAIHLTGELWQRDIWMTTWIYLCTIRWIHWIPWIHFRENGDGCRCHNLNMTTWGSVVVIVVGSGGEILMSWKTDIGDGKLDPSPGIWWCWQLKPKELALNFGILVLDASGFGQPSRWINQDLVLPHIQSTFQYFFIGNMMLSHLFIGVSSFVTSPNSIIWISVGQSPV